MRIALHDQRIAGSGWEVSKQSCFAWLVCLVVACCSASCRWGGEEIDYLPPPGTHAPTSTTAPRVPLGLNLGSLNYYAPTLPFLDTMKNADDPQTTNAAGGGAWDTELISKVPLDSAGFPLEVPYAGTGVTTPQAVRYAVVSLEYAGKYTLLYDGEGAFTFPASPAKVLDQMPGIIHIDAPKGEGSLFVQITKSAKANHVRNVRLILPGFEQNYDTMVYHPKFISQISGASVLRFMDWQRTNDSKLAHWKDRATPEMAQGTWRGASIETMLDIAKRVGADPWFCVPHVADDDFIEQMAKLIKDKLPPNNVVYVEFSNEIWNGIFGQQAYANMQGCAAGLQNLEPEMGLCSEDGGRFWAGTKWTAQRAAKVFETFERVFGGTDRIVRVLGGQAADTHRNSVFLRAFADEKLNPKGIKADALAIAPYFGGVADSLVEAMSPNSITVDMILQKMDESIEPQVRDLTRKNKEIAERFGMRLIGYEGGQHLVATGDASNNDALTQKLIAANRDPRMGTLYQRMFDAWYEESGRELLVLFNSAEVPSKYGSWGLLESQEQPPDRAPKYRAFRDQLTKLATSSEP